MRSLGLVVLACAPALAETPKTAKDDLAHKKAELAPLLAKAQACMPPATQDLDWVLDAYDGKLVACVQAMTRRGTSAFLDPVSYACWNVDPATGVVARRGDLGRSYFRCQDGSCAPDRGNRAVSWDGASILAVDDKTVAVTDKKGKQTASFATPKELVGQTFQRGELTLVGHTVFAIVDKTVHAYADTGKALGTFTGEELRVLDATTVAGVDPSGDDGALFDLTTNKATPIKGHELDVEARVGAKYHRLDKLFPAIETWDDKRTPTLAKDIAACKP